MTNSPTDEQIDEMIEEAIRTLAAEGLLYDTGKRKWSERPGAIKLFGRESPRSTSGAESLAPSIARLYGIANSKLWG